MRISQREISITATHISNLEAQVRLDVNIFQGLENRDVHIQNGDPLLYSILCGMLIQRKSWIAATGVIRPVKDAIGPSRVFVGLRSDWTLTTIEG